MIANSGSPEIDDDHEVGPSRRVGASRVPESYEVVRMLLALADHTLSTAKLRADMESTSGENEERKRFASALKKANTAWEGEKKKLTEARVLCKCAAETKANKELVRISHRL